MTATYLTVGEALTDIVTRADGDSTEYPGGSPLNVAVALGRLGHSSHLLTMIGQDARGEQIRRHVEESRVQLTGGSIGPEPTSTALAMIDAEGTATYQFDIAWAPRETGLPEHVDALHTSSIAAVLSPGAATVASVLERYRPTATISYDPNARPSLMGSAAQTRPAIEAIIARADVVKTSDEDVAWLYGTDDVEDVVASWRELGPAITVLTRGGEGAVGFAAAGRIAVDPVKVEVADTVGAGDTFSAGLLDALGTAGLLGAVQREGLHAIGAEQLRTVLARAARLAAVTVSRPGANPPWAHEIDGA
ncbi:carbohydrate kinase family protein [Brachybacterium hainanense]|uniref:Carbohydrate kinase n=1 Tax=Brachybacterium hainanense TaxID=1541174 RepID=A0ABV6R7R1_9MICO